MEYYHFPQKNFNMILGFGILKILLQINIFRHDLWIKLQTKYVVTNLILYNEQCHMVGLPLRTAWK